MDLEILNAPKVLSQFENRKHGMINCMRLKIEEKDWFGVAGSAIDIMEIKVELNVWQKFVKSGSDSV